MKPHRTYLTAQFFTLFALIELTGLICVFLPWLLPFYVAGHAVVALLMLREILSLPKAKDFRIETRLPATLEIGKDDELVLTLIGDLKKSLKLGEIKLESPVLTTLKLPAFYELANPAVDAEHVYFEERIPVHPRALGFEVVSEMRLFLTSTMGLFAREITVPCAPPLKFRVMPTKREIGEQAFRDILSNQRLFVQGNRKLLRSNMPEQFYSMRKYQYPDPIRFIDAKKSAKYQELMTRVFDSFFEHHLILGLDVGRASLGYLGRSRKFDYHLSACLALAKNAVRTRDRVSFFAFSQKIHYMVRQAKNFQSFHPLFEGAKQVRPREVDSQYELVVPAVHKLTGQRSVVLLITDATRPSVQENLLRVLPYLCAKHLTVVVSLVDSRYDLDALVVSGNQSKLSVDAYNRILYSYWVRDRMAEFQRKVNRLGGATLSLSEKDWLSAIVHLYGILRSSANL